MPSTTSQEAGVADMRSVDTKVCTNLTMVDIVVTKNETSYTASSTMDTAKTARTETTPFRRSERV